MFNNRLRLVFIAVVLCIIGIQPFAAQARDVTRVLFVGSFTNSIAWTQEVINSLDEYIIENDANVRLETITISLRNRKELDIDEDDIANINKKLISGKFDILNNLK